MKDAMRAVAAFALVVPAVAYKRIAAAVPGTIVSESDFAGGQIAGYQAVEETVNPLFKELELTMACCVDSQPMADEIANKVNTNEIYADGAEEFEQKVVSMYKDKCSKVDIRESMEKGKPECSYAFIFDNAKFADLRYQATCVPAQICANNVGGMTDGRIALYGVVLRVLMKTYGELAYIGQGWTSFCEAGMHEVNKGNLDYFFTSKPVMWGSTVLGELPKSIEVPGMDKVGVFDAFNPCPPDPYKGYLFIFDNKAWDKGSSTTNTTQLSVEVERLEKNKDAKKKLEDLGQTLGQSFGVLRKLQQDDVLI